MKKNQVVLVLSCLFSLLFIFGVVKLTDDLGKVETTLANSPNVEDVTKKIITRVLVSAQDLGNKWYRFDYKDTEWKKILIPKTWLPKEHGFEQGNFAYFRIYIPKDSISKISHLKNEAFLSLYYVLFNRVDIYVNGQFYRTNSPTNYNESLLNIPIAESSDNLIALKGYIRTGDTGINHRSRIFAGKGAELNELHRKSYKGQTVFSLIFILCKSSILFIFTLIFVMVKVEKFFEKSLLYSMFVIFEDILTGDYVSHLLNFHEMVYLYNVANIGAIICLFLFMADVLQEKYSRNFKLGLLSSLIVISSLVTFDVLYWSKFLQIDGFLKFWNIVLIVTLLKFIPRVFKTDTILTLSLTVAVMLTSWSTFFSSNVGHNLKAFAGLLIFFSVAYETFILFRRQQIQLMEQEKDVAIGKTAALLAHDVRRPLDQMRFVLERIVKGETDEAFLKVAQQDVDFAITSVNSQINDIMNFSRTKEALLSPISFYQVLSGSIKQVLSVQSGVSIDLKYDFKAKNLILGEESRLSNALTNLIANAVEAIRDIGKKKHGTIFFSTAIEKDQFVFSIKNDGPVIPEKYLNEIFKPLFTQGKSSGTGLGLASVHKVVREHGGRITVKNDHDGVRFEIKLKILKEFDVIPMDDFRSNSSLYLYSEPVQTDSRVKKKLRVFLLDDDKYVFEYFKDLSQKTSFEVELAYFSNLEDAAAAVVAKRYDLYILDYDLGSSSTGVDFFNANLKKLKTKTIIHSSRYGLSEEGSEWSLYQKPLSLQAYNNLLIEADNDRLKILLVEDSKLIAVGWKVFHGDHNIVHFVNPENALDYISKVQDFDCAVIDYHYDSSSMNGYELAQKVSNLTDKKIFIMSSMQGVSEEFEAISKTGFEVRILL